MADNAFKGEVSLTIGGKKGTLVFDWDAIAAIQTAFGKLISNIYTMTPDEIAALLEIGFKLHNPEITAAKIKAVKPPLFPCLEAIDRALAYSYFGIDKAPKAKTEDETPVAEKKTGKKAQKKTS